MADIKETKEVEVVIKAKTDEASIANAEKKMDRLEKKINKTKNPIIKKAPTRFYKGKKYTVEDRPFDRMKDRIRSRGVFSEIKSRFKKRDSAGVFGNISSKKDSFFSAIQTPGEISSTIKRKFNDKMNKLMSNSLFKRAKGMLGDKQSKPYENAPFRKAMMYIGSGMLLQYAVMMAGRAVAGVLQAASDAEVENLTGKEYRKELANKGANVKQFDETYKLYSERTGTAKYASRARFGRLYGKLSTAGVSASFDPNTIVRVMRGMQFMTGESEEQVDKRLYKLLSGRAGKEERREFGVTSSNSPTAILNEIHETLKKNAAARVGMDNILLQDRLRAIASAPQDMISMVHSMFPSIFNNIGENFKNFVMGIFQSEPGDVQKRWVAFFETINQLSAELFDKEKGEGITTTILDIIGPILATITDAIKFAKQFNKDSNDAFGRLFDLAKRINSITGVLEYAFGIAGWISAALAKALDKLVAVAEFLVDLPGRIKSKISNFFGGSDKDDDGDDKSKKGLPEKPPAPSDNVYRDLMNKDIFKLKSNAPMQGDTGVQQVGEWDPTTAPAVQVKSKNKPIDVVKLEDTKPAVATSFNTPDFDKNLFIASTYSNNKSSGTVINANVVYVKDGEATVDNMMNGAM